MAREKVRSAHSWASGGHEKEALTGQYPKPFYDHFHLHQTDDEDKAQPMLVQKIGQVLGATGEGLAKTQEIVDVNPKEAKPNKEGAITAGYVRFRGGEAVGRIHLNFSKLAEPINNLARTLVHEATHRYANTDDVEGKSYPWQPGYKKLTFVEAQKSAETYAAFTFDEESR
jgi:hypothetical protein